MLQWRDLFQGIYTENIERCFLSVQIYIQLLCSGPRYGSVQFLFSTGKMCKFSRTLYYAKVSIAAQYLLLMSPYSWCLRDLRVQFLELYTACILSRYFWDKAFHFPGNFHFLVKTITETPSSLRNFFCSVQRTALYSTVCGPQWHYHNPRFI